MSINSKGGKRGRDVRMTLFRYFIFGVIFLAAAVCPARAASSIVIRLVVVNPSAEEAQTAVVKSYLPKEVQPEDVLRKGDLQVIYDAQQGSYYVYGEVELKPSEVLEQEVELRDIWYIPDAEIESLRAESAKYGDLVKGSEFADRITFLCGSAETKLTQIEERQKASPANPEQKISSYRENLKVLESVKADLSTVRSLLAQSKPFSAKAVWGMILGIIIFLGILGVSFYFVWYRQVKAAPLAEDSFYVPGGQQESEQGQSRQQEGQKKKEVKDVDQILEEGN